MQKAEFTRIRKKLGKTQKQMSALLGVSQKAIESYEQGLRNIPSNIERILYYLLFKLNMDKLGEDEKKLCWDKKDCPQHFRENCLAWMAKEGFFCWFITGKICPAEKQLSHKSTGTCFNCSFFKDQLNAIL